MTFLGSNFGVDISARLKWALWWRVLFLAILLMSSISIDLFVSGLVSPELYWISIAGLGISLLMIAGMRWRWTTSQLVALSWLQIVVDIGMVASLVFITGGLYSAFSLLYGLNIVLASVLLFSRGAIVASILSVASLLISSFVFDAEFSWQLSSGLRLLLVSSSLLLVGGLISLLFRNREELIQSLKAKSKDLRSLAELQSAIVENIPSGLLLLDRDRNVLYANTLAQVILETSIDNMNFDDLHLDPEVLTRDSIELQRQSKGQGLRTLRFHRVGLKSGEILLVCEDLTKVRELERSLLIKEKLEGIGQLATGLAHEIKNPLASLSGSIQLLNREMDLDESQRRLMQIVLRETDRLDDLLQNFLDYARPSKPRLEKVDLVAMVSEITELFKNSDEVISKKARIELENTKTSLIIECDPSRIRQVFWNLIKNAVAAIGKQGLIKVVLSEESTQVVCEVSDDGEGMTDETKYRLFEPFYTSKEKGTGLGMATVYQILQLHGSSLRFESQLGKGTRFQFELSKKFGFQKDHKEQAA